MAEYIDGKGFVVDAYLWGSREPWPEWIRDGLDQGLLSFGKNDGYFTELVIHDGEQVARRHDWVVNRNGLMQVYSPEAFTAKFIQVINQ